MFSVLFEHRFLRNVGVDLSGIKRLVTKEFLDKTEVRSIIQKMGCEAMSHLMRMEAITAACFDLDLFEDIFKASDCEVLPFS